jgi:hypothetical protein
MTARYRRVAPFGWTALSGRLPFPVRFAAGGSEARLPRSLPRFEALVGVDPLY